MALIKAYPDTVAGKQEKLRDRMSQMLNNSFNSVKITIENGRNHIWNNVDGLTPQQCFDAFGTDAAQLLVASAAAIGMVNAIIPGSEDASLPNGHTVTINQDGTVTVTS